MSNLLPRICLMSTECNLLFSIFHKPSWDVQLFLEKKPSFDYNLLAYRMVGVRDVAQLGSALPWGGRGHGFKSHRSDQYVIWS